MKKNRTVKELNLDFEELLKRVKQLEENRVIEKPNSDNNEFGFKAILESYDQKIKHLAKMLDKKENVGHKAIHMW